MNSNGKKRFNKRDGQHSFAPEDCLIKAYYSDHALKMAEARQIPFPIYVQRSSGKNLTEVRREYKDIKKTEEWELNHETSHLWLKEKNADADYSHLYSEDARFLAALVDEMPMELQPDVLETVFPKLLDQGLIDKKTLKQVIHILFPDITFDVKPKAQFKRVLQDGIPRYMEPFKGSLKEKKLQKLRKKGYGSKAPQPHSKKWNDLVIRDPYFALLHSFDFFDGFGEGEWPFDDCSYGGETLHAMWLTNAQLKKRKKLPDHPETLEEDHKNNVFDTESYSKKFIYALCDYAKEIIRRADRENMDNLMPLEREEEMGCKYADYNKEDWAYDKLNFCNMELVKWNTENERVDGEVVTGTFLTQPSQGKYYEITALLKSPLTKEEYNKLMSEYVGGRHADSEKIRKRVESIGFLQKLTKEDLFQIMLSHGEKDFCFVITVTESTHRDAKKEIGLVRAGEIKY